MNLLAQEMNETVFAMAYFVHRSGNISDFAFGTYFIKINGKNTGKLFNFFIIRCNIGIEYFGDFALKKIGIVDKNAAKPQVDDECREQFFHHRL